MIRHNKNWLPLLLLIIACGCDNYNSHKNKIRTQQSVNALKNRQQLPAPGDVNQKVTLATFINSHDNPALLSEDSAATIEGYLVKVKQEKGESCNNYSSNPDDWDYHVYIAPDDSTSHVAGTMVTEVTPYTRTIHPEFTLKYLRKLKGKKVRITGWIMYDFEHLDVSAGAHPNAEKVYRRTVYEIHPVTNIEVVE